MYVYKIVNKINGKIYVGQTTEKLNQRFSRHMGYQKDDKDTKFYRAVRKYGKSNFYIELIEEVKTLEELNTREEYWIRKLDTVENGYNSYYGGYSSGGDTLSNHPRLKEIKKLTGAPLVLHGGSGSGEKNILNSVKYGINKINEVYNAKKDDDNFDNIVRELNDELSRIWQDACHYYHETIEKNPDYIIPDEYAAFTIPGPPVARIKLMFLWLINC